MIEDRILQSPFSGHRTNRMTLRARTLSTAVLVPLLFGVGGGCVQAEKGRYDAVLRARVDPGADQRRAVARAFGIDDTGRDLNDVLAKDADAPR